MASLIKRGKIYYAQYYMGKRQKRISLGTKNYQIAKAKLSEMEASLSQSEDSPFPTKTPLTKAVQQYLDHIRAIKSPGSALKDANILRLIFGPIIPALEQIGRKKRRRKWNRSEESQKRQQTPRGANWKQL